MKIIFFLFLPLLVFSQTTISWEKEGMAVIKNLEQKFVDLSAGEKKLMVKTKDGFFNVLDSELICEVTYYALHKDSDLIKKIQDPYYSFDMILLTFYFHSQEYLPKINIWDETDKKIFITPCTSFLVENRENFPFLMKNEENLDKKQDASDEETF